MDFIPDPDDVWRCYTCGKGYKSERGLATHITKTHPCRQWTGSTADKDTRHKKRVAAQKRKPKVSCEGKPLKNVWSFVYLGAKFSADGDPTTDVKARIAKALKTAGKMRHVWDSKCIPMTLKLRIYIVGVCSQLAYGSEAWKLDENTIRMLNGINSRLLHRITGKTYKEEASEGTRTFDLVRWIRARRAQWLGHILRMDPSRMAQQAVQLMHEDRSSGDLLTDAPDLTWDELVKFAANRDAWRTLVGTVRNGSRVHVDAHHETTRSTYLLSRSAVNSPTTTTTAHDSIEITIAARPENSSSQIPRPR